jgi:ERCC4-type nuclease
MCSSFRIGDKKAKELLQVFPSISLVANASETALKDHLGTNPSSKLLSFFEQPFDS